MKHRRHESEFFTRRAAMAVCVAIVLAAIGCSHVPAPDADLIPANVARQAAPTVDRRIGILPLIVDDEFETHFDATNRATGIYRRAFKPGPDFGRPFIEAIVGALRQVGCAREMRFLPADGRSLDAVLNEAWADGLDFVIRPLLRRRDCSYVGHASAYIPNLIVWFLIPSFVTWWVADEIFASEMAVALEVYSTAESDAAPILTHEITARVQHDLNDFDQGFNFFDIFITPSGLSDGHWGDIGTRLLPLSEQACQREFIRWMGDVDAGLAAELAATRDRTRKTLAIVCGAPPAQIRPPRFAIDDARRIAESLRYGPLPMLSARGLVLLDGARATFNELHTAIEMHFVRHAHADDRLVLVLLGQGFIDADGHGHLLLANAVIDEERRPSGAISVADLAAQLKALPAPVAVISAVAWRPITDETIAARDVQPLAPLTALPNVMLLDAAPRGPLLEMEQATGSLFVHVLLAKLRDGRSADADGDSFLSLREIADAVAGPLTEFSQLDGTPQTPKLNGPDNLIRLPLLPALAADSPVNR